MEMVVKKGNTSDTKVKNGAAKTNRAKGNDSGSLLDKNGNMLPAENRSKREEKCQVKRQGLKATINTETNRKDSKALPPPGELITSHESSDGTIYELEDCVYIDSQRPDVPFFICAIKEFRMCKRECLYVGVKWFYRPSEVPESVYQLLVQDRNAENGSRDHILEDSSVKERELFVSDAVDTYSVSALRGKCKVKCLSEVPGLKEFISHNDNFFYVLRYNPETRRLANHKGEIRVGPSHQVLLPECKPKDEASNDLSSLSLKEELTWRPTLDDYDLMMFVGAARSMAQYAGICKEGDTNKGLTVAARDATTINALKVLHESKYDTAQALQALVKRPFPKTSRMNWTDDEMKRFVKGLRQYGKNFYKIKKELLPQKETGDLVEYYYTWKKTPSALSSRPHRRRRHNVLRRRNLTRAAKASSEFLVLSSCSEDEYDSEDSEMKDFSLYCCRYCYSSDSKSWHHGGYDRLILCNECLTYFKKYGVMRKIGEVREPPPYMFKVVEKENDEDYYVNGKQLRSRRSTPNISGSLRYGRSKACSPLDAVIARESPINGRKLTRLSKPDSPSGASTGSNTSSSSSNKKSQPAKRRRTKKTSEPSPEKILPPKRKKSITRESDEEETDQSEGNSSPAMDQESVAVEGDVISISSRTSTNEEARASPSLETIEPEHECEAGKFPARKVLDGETSARTALPFTPNKKPVVRTEENKETGERKSKEKKHENEECSTQRSQKPENRTPSETVTASATVTSHQEHLRKYMAAGAYSRYSHGYPGMPVHAAPMMQMSLPNPCDAALLQWQLHSGLKDLRDAKDFENWYAPYKVPRVRNNPTHPLPPSLLHSAPLMDGQRNSPLHRHKDGIIFPGGPTPLGTDPVTGLPQHHSHSHVHTHYHLHPGEQHLNQPRSPSLSSLEPNWMWRNNHVTPGHEMWLHPQMLSGHGRHLMNPGEEFNGISPYFPGLYPPSREYQLQHELMSQGLKIDHGYSFYHPFLSASREHSMRYVRPHDRQPRLGTIDEPSASLLHRADVRSMRSPSLKNFESGSHMLSTNQKPSTIHPILVDDD